MQYRVLCHFALIASLSGCSAAAEDPDYQFLWVRTFHGPCCGDQGNDLVVDSTGAALVAGQRGPIDLDRDGNTDLDVAGLQDALVFQSADNGMKGWVQGPGGPGMDQAQGIASDGEGGAYVVGHFNQPGFEIDGETLALRGVQDGFLVRYDSEGKPVWSLAVGGGGRDRLTAAAMDADGNVYVTGVAAGEVDVDRDGTVDLDAGQGGLLLASFTPDGDMRWARTSQGGFADGVAIEAGAGDAVYVAGRYRGGGLDLDGDGVLEGEEVPNNRPRGFLARFNGAGELQWVRWAAAAGPQTFASLATTSDGGLVVLGGGLGPVDFDGDGAPEFQGGAQEPIGYLTRWENDGSLTWARRLGGSPVHVSTSADRIGLAGFYEGGPLDLDRDGKADGPADSDARRSQGFVAVLDLKGNLQHTFIIDGPESDRALAGGFTPDGKQFFATGYLRLTSDFDGDGKLEAGVRCDSLGDAFLALYQLDRP